MDLSGIHDRPPVNLDALGRQVPVHRLQQLLAQVVLLDPVPETEDRRGVRRDVLPQVQPQKLLDGVRIVHPSAAFRHSSLP